MRQCKQKNGAETAPFLADYISTTPGLSGGIRHISLIASGFEYIGISDSSPHIAKAALHDSAQIKTFPYRADSIRKSFIALDLSHTLQSLPRIPHVITRHAGPHPMSAVICADFCYQRIGHVT
jgi:hypothetical protein